MIKDFRLLHKKIFSQKRKFFDSKINTYSVAISKLGLLNNHKTVIVT